MWSWFRFLACVLAAFVAVFIVIVGIWSMTKLPWPNTDFSDKSPERVLDEKYRACVDTDKDWTYNKVTGSFRCT